MQVGEILDKWQKEFLKNSVVGARNSIENILMYVLKTEKVVKCICSFDNISTRFSSIIKIDSLKSEKLLTLEVIET